MFRNHHAVGFFTTDIEFVGGGFILEIFDARQCGLDFIFAEGTEARE